MASADLGRGMLAALRSSPRRGDKAHARNNARTMSDKQAQSEAAGSPVTRSSAAARAVQSEPKAGPQHARSTASDWAQAASQARASLAKKQAGAMPDLAPPSAAAPAAAPVRAEAVEPPVQPSNVQAFVAASSAGPVGAEALLQAGAAAPAAVAAPAPAAAAPQPPEVPAVPAEAQAQPAVDATSIPATVPEAEPDAKRPLAAGQSAPAETANGSKPAAGGVLEAERADPQLAAAAAGVLPAGRDAAPQPQQVMHSTQLPLSSLCGSTNVTQFQLCDIRPESDILVVLPYFQVQDRQHISVRCRRVCPMRGWRQIRLLQHLRLTTRSAPPSTLSRSARLCYIFSLLALMFFSHIPDNV